jgi:hypothetical protein
MRVSNVEKNEPMTVCSSCCGTYTLCSSKSALLKFSKSNLFDDAAHIERTNGSVVRQENFLAGIYIDNDHDTIVPIEKFIELGLPVD